MTNTEIRVTLDDSAGVAYIQLSDAEIARTVEHDEAGSLIVDLDTNGEAVGIEILDTQMQIPLSDLEKAYHIRSERAALIGHLLPSISYSMRAAVVPDSTLTKVPSLDLARC